MACLKKEISVKDYLIKGGSSVVNMDIYNHVYDGKLSAIALQPYFKLIIQQFL